MKRFLALWLPNWPVQRLVLDQPELMGRAIVLHEKHPRYGELVKACSAKAAARGVRPGMPLAEAQALQTCAEKKPGFSEKAGFLACFAPHDARGDREALAKLAAWCERFSPIVGLDQTDEPDCLLMDISGLAQLFGGEEALAHTVAKAFRERGFQVRVAVADTIGAARAVARFGVDHGQRPYQVVQVVPPGDQKTLDRLPVAALRLPVRTMEQLKRLGMDTIGQLRRLPRTSLAARFQDDLIEGLDRIVGDAQEVIVSHKPAAELAAHWSLEHATTHRGAIDYVLEQLLHQLSRGLIEQGQGVLQLECRLVGKNHRPLVVKAGLFQPTISPQHLLGLLKMQLERLVLSEAVEEIRVAATVTAPRERRQNELFVSSSRDDPSKLAFLVERLSARLGRERVVRAELQAESQVELAYRCVPLTGEPAHESACRAAYRRSGTKKRRTSPPQGPSTPPQGGTTSLGPMLRPLRIFDPPEPVDVIGIALDGPPAMFRYRRRPYRVARHFGPERIETGWWRGPSSCRDYYRVETETGNRMWLFRRLQDKKWFLQGEFV